MIGKSHQRQNGRGFDQAPSFRDAPLGANPESRDSGFDAEPVIGPRFARTRWHRPGMTVVEALRSPMAARRRARTDRRPICQTCEKCSAVVELVEVAHR